MDLTPAEKKRINTALNVVNRYATEGDEQQFGNIIRDLRVVLRESTGEKREQLNKELLELNKKRSLRGVRSNLDSLFKKYELTTGEEVSTTGSESEKTDSDNFPSLDEQEEEKAESTAKPVKKVTPKNLDLGGAGAGAGSEDKYLPPKPPGSTIAPKPKPKTPSQTKSPLLRGKPKPPPSSTIAPKPKPKAPAQTKAPAQIISSSEESSSEEYTDDDFTDDEPTPMMEEPDPSQTPAPAPAPPVPPPPPPPVPPLEQLEEEAKVDLKVEKAKVTKIDDQLKLDPGVNPPSKQMGKSLEDLSVEEINKDLDYFYSTFGNRLKKLKRSRSKNIEVLKRFYKRVLALLRVEDKKEEKGDKQIGIIIKGSDFIKDKLKEIILENSIDGLTAKDLLINIEGDEDKDKADAGKYEFKTNPTSGKKYAQGEPVDRLIPTQDPKQVAEVHSDHTASSYKKKPSRLQMPKTMFRSDVVTARKMVRNNPFLNAKQPMIKLKTIY